MRTLTIAVTIGVALALPHATRAATFTVNSTADGIDATPGDGVCATSKGQCTLRAAILEANALAGADTITLPAGRFGLAIRGTDDDAGATGDLDITADLVINGAGEAATIVSGNRIDRVFDVHGPARAMLSGMTIMLGQPPAATDNPEGDDDLDLRSNGGGLLNDGIVTLTNVTFSRNRAGRGAGWAGAIMNLGTATLTHVTLVHNRAGDAYCVGRGVYCSGFVGETFAGDVGGMWNTGTATLTGVTFRANRAGERGITDSDGGAVGALLNEGTATLVDVTFSLNRAGNGLNVTKTHDGLYGGWAGAMENDGTATLAKVTFDRNLAGSGIGGDGGGMLNYGDATLTDVTFRGNRAGDSNGIDGGIAGNGGGLFNDGTVTITNATFDRNRAGDGAYSGGGSGGGIFSDGDMTLVNAIITRNRAGNGTHGYYATQGCGGGLALSPEHSATVTNVTLALNRAGKGPNHDTEYCGGNQIASDGGVSLINTIVFGPGRNCSGPLVSLGHNLDSGTTCGFAAPGDLSNTAPRLATQTGALFPGSPAIDAGDDNACPATDRRGIARPQGAACDIGAYEFGP